jgi:hypothetical protein
MPVRDVIGRDYHLYASVGWSDMRRAEPETTAPTLRHAVSLTMNGDRYA